jgi:hypothetical protein
MGEMADRLQEQFEEARAKAAGGAGEHLRVPEAVAHMWLGVDTALRYAEEIGACDPREAEAHRERLWAALSEIGRAQGQLVEGERPTKRFLRVLLTLVTQSAVRFGSQDEDADDSMPGRPFIGWQHDDSLYLIPDATFQAVARFCRDTGEPFPVKQNRLNKDLAREGLLVHDEKRYTTTARLGKDNQTKRVLLIRLDKAESLLGETFPGHQEEANTQEEDEEDDLE